MHWCSMNCVRITKTVWPTEWLQRSEKKGSLGCLFYRNWFRGTPLNHRTGIRVVRVFVGTVFFHNLDQVFTLDT